MIPIKNPGANPCVEKFVKIRVVDKTATPNSNFLCANILDAQGCRQSVTQGKELKLENSSRFVTGACKQTIYQVCNNTNPDGGIDGAITSGLPYQNTIATILGIDPEFDDTIIPFFGLTPDKDIVRTFKDADGEWCFLAPIQKLAASLRSVVFTLDMR